MRSHAHVRGRVRSVLRCALGPAPRSRARVPHSVSCTSEHAPLPTYAADTVVVSPLQMSCGPPLQNSYEPLPDNPMRPPPEPPKPLEQAWVDDRRRQTLGMFELLCEHRYLMADAHQDTHAVAKRLLRGALKACIDPINGKTVGHAIGSPASWGILLAQQARAELHGLEMDDEAGACTWPLSA